MRKLASALVLSLAGLVAGAGTAYAGPVDVQVDEDAEADYVAVSVFGSSDGFVSVTVFGTACGDGVTISAFGDAGGC